MPSTAAPPRKVCCCRRTVKRASSKRRIARSNPLQNLEAPFEMPIPQTEYVAYPTSPIVRPMAPCCDFPGL